MRIDDVNTYWERHQIGQHSSTVTLSFPAGALTIFQIGPTDTIEACLAVLIGMRQTAPLLVLLHPEASAFSCVNHFAWLKQAETPRIAALVFSSNKADLAASVAQIGFSCVFSVEQALMDFQQPQLSTSLPRPRGRSTGALVWPTSTDILQLFPSPSEAGTGIAYTWQAPAVPPFSQLSAAPVAALPVVAPGQPEATSRVPGQTSLPLRKNFSRKRKRRVWALLVLLGLAVLVVLPFLLAPTALPNAPTAASASQIGDLLFSGSGQLDPTSSVGLNDIVTLNVHHVNAPAAGKTDYAWLLPDNANDEAQTVLLGTLNVQDGAATLTYNSPTHSDLLAIYSRILITQEPLAPAPMMPSMDQTTWVYQGAVPNTPTPGDENRYSYLDHLRHLLATDPTIAQIGLSGGLDIWMYRNTGKVYEWVSAARDEWTTNNPGGIRANVIRMLDYLDGEPEAWRDLPPDTPFLADRKDGHFGLINLDQNQNPPGYLDHISVHLTGLVDALGVTALARQLATQLRQVLTQAEHFLQNMRADARQLVLMTNAQLQQASALALLNDMLTQANNAYIGVNNPATGQAQGGIMYLYNQLQRLGEIPIF